MTCNKDLFQHAPEERHFSRRELIQTVAAATGAALLLQRDAQATAAESEPVTSTRDRFPHFQSTPVSYWSVKMQDTFWAPRQKVIRDVTVPWATRHFDAAGGVEAFRADPGTYKSRIIPDDMTAIPFIESMAAVVGLERDAAIEGLIDAWAKVLIDRQAPDGYLQPAPGQTYGNPPKRWKPLAVSHETYLIGCYVDAAIAYRQSTGSPALYHSALRAIENMAEALLHSGRPYFSGNCKIEQSLMQLYGATGDVKHLQLCQLFLEQRGRHAGRATPGKAFQDHIPVKNQRTIEGHAVSAARLFDAVTQYVGATGDSQYREAVLAVWQDLADRKMYIQGASGNLNSGFEGYKSEPFSIPPADTYGESCAIFENIHWAENLFRLTGEAKYVNEVELMLHNAFYASLSLKGDRYFYRNVSESFDPVLRYDWHPCPCCPPSIVTLLSKIGGLFYSTDPSGIFVKQYGASQATIPFRNGVKLTQVGAYPWDEHVSIKVDPATPSQFIVRLRVPSWVNSPAIEVNGKPMAFEPKNGWIEVHRHWETGDEIELQLPMPIERVTMPPAFKDYTDLVAFRRGPIIYCLEQTDVDHPIGPSSWSCLYAPSDVRFEAKHRPDVLGGITVLEGVLPQANVLYTNIASVPVTLVPYGVWNNRAPGGMTIWLPTKAVTLDDVEKSFESLGTPS